MNIQGPFPWVTNGYENTYVAIVNFMKWSKQVAITKINKHSTVKFFGTSYPAWGPRTRWLPIMEPNSLATYLVSIAKAWASRFGLPHHIILKAVVRLKGKMYKFYRALRPRYMSIKKHGTKWTDHLKPVPWENPTTPNCAKWETSLFFI